MAKIKIKMASADEVPPLAQHQFDQHRFDQHQFAENWIASWNAHDLDAILSHYEDAIELTSPVAARLLGDGKVVGKTNLKAYFQRGLEAYPDLHFRLLDVFAGLNSIVLHYENQSATRTAEFMELSASGKITRVVANYSVSQQK